MQNKKDPKMPLAPAQKFFELIESLPMVAVQGYNRKRQVIYWNEASRRLYGYTPEEAQGQLLEDLIIPDHMREAVIKAHQNWLDKNISIPSEETDLKHKDGRAVPVYSSHVMIKQDTGECEMFCIDISLQEQKKAKEELYRMASIDDLTQLPNRRLMEAELSARIAETRRTKRTMAIVFIDLDNFKLINDTLGHSYGDKLIKAVAEALESEIRSNDLLSRFGGDEFVLLLFDVTAAERIHELLRRLIHRLDQGFVLDGDCYQVTASFGVSLFPGDGETVAELMGNADAAMYQAKEKGKNNICFYTSDINDRLIQYQQITGLLRRAIDDDHLAHIRVDINLSGKQLTNQHLADQILQNLEYYDLPPAQLGVELTENEVFGGDEAQIKQLEKLKQAGVHISIDDFGTGHSSLVYLRKLPVCSLKIDKTFLRYAMENDSDMAIMQAIITVGHRLGLSVVVEGVETPEQDQLVRNLGCDLAQGFLYARPMPANQMPSLLADADAFPWPTTPDSR